MTAASHKRVTNKSAYLDITIDIGYQYPGCHLPQ